MNLNINWSAYITYNLQAGMATIHYSDYFFSKSHLEVKKSVVSFHELKERVHENYQQIFTDVFVNKELVAEPIILHAYVNDLMPDVIFQAYVLYLEDTIEILCLEESLEIQTLRNELFTEDIYLSLINYDDLDTRIDAHKDFSIINRFLLTINDLMS